MSNFEYLLAYSENRYALFELRPTEGIGDAMGVALLARRLGFRAIVVGLAPTGRQLSVFVDRWSRIGN